MKHERFAICLLAIALFLAFTPEALALSALEPWNAEARDALPRQVKVWLGLMMLTNLVGIAFLKNHVAARWTFGGYAIGHTLVMILWAQDITVLVGQVALVHILFWTPGAIQLLRRRSELRWPSAYGVWAVILLCFYFGSMIFDIPDGFRYLLHAIA